MRQDRGGIKAFVEAATAKARGAARKLRVMLAVLLVCVAAGDSSTNTTTATSPPTVSVGHYADFMPTIVDIAKNSSLATADLSTWVAALGACDLVSTLNGTGPFTVFAPTNAAFDALPKGLVSALLRPENKAKLVELLTYHVANGKVILMSNQQIPTLQGTSVNVTILSSGVYINNAYVTTPNVEASNGVVHIIDMVLLPLGWGGTIVDVAATIPDLSTLVTALTASDLDSTILTLPGPFTVFAPTNAAFAALPAGTLQNLLKPENKWQLDQLLTYHVVLGATLASEITNGIKNRPTLLGQGMTIRTFLGQEVVATLQSDGGLMINDATVTLADVIVSNGTAALNGVVHIIDKVLIPSTPEAATIDYIASVATDLLTLSDALAASGLGSTLDGPGPFTLFAPTNAAFDALPKGLFMAVLQEAVYGDKTKLLELLTYHVANGTVLSGSLMNNQQIPTLQGTNVSVTISSGSVSIKCYDGNPEDRRVFSDATVTTPDVNASNGVVHIVDKVLVPSGWGGGIIDLLAAIPELSTFVAAVTASDLHRTLSVRGPWWRTRVNFTVFAPTNAAFAALPAGVLKDLLRPENKAELVRLLAYHIVPEATLAREFTNNTQITTLHGENVVVTLPPGGWWPGMMINNATVTRRDLIFFNGTAALNGVVHIIDQVLTPPTWLKTLVPVTLSPTPTASPQTASPALLVHAAGNRVSYRELLCALGLWLGGVLLCGGLGLFLHKQMGTRKQGESPKFANQWAKLDAETI